MKKPPFPKNERQRQKAVESYAILDTIEEESYDNITSLIANICEVPISLMSILDNDRNFLKSHFGVAFQEDPRDHSFCGHTILEEDGFLIVHDAAKDSRFKDNPLVTDLGVRFYAGASLINSSGIKLGALCIFDKKPRVLSKFQKQALEKLSKQVMLLMESRLLNINLINAENELKERNQELEKFASATSHDLKSPLNSIVGLVNLLKSSAISKLSEQEVSYIDHIKQSANSLTNYISGLLRFYKSEKSLTDQFSNVKYDTLVKEILSANSSPNKNIIFHSKVKNLNIHKSAITQVLMNLISNGLKYNESDTPIVTVSIDEDDLNYYFDVKDNGIGIPEKDRERVFELFETTNSKDREGKVGTGIGLATVNKIIKKMDGSIQVTSETGKGSNFKCVIPKR
jgi:signal transduction histidine kinase